MRVQDHHVGEPASPAYFRSSDNRAPSNHSKCTKATTMPPPRDSFPEEPMPQPDNRDIAPPSAKPSLSVGLPAPAAAKRAKSCLKFSSAFCGAEKNLPFLINGLHALFSLLCAPLRILSCARRNRKHNWNTKRTSADARPNERLFPLMAL